jgi:hypothetical protein
MLRWFVIAVALFLPLQFAWSAASAYCEHEAGDQQVQHFGHHVHACKDESSKSPDSKLKAHADCGSCQAANLPGIATKADARAFRSASTRAAVVTPSPFSSALPRAPDRPQWLRLV